MNRISAIWLAESRPANKSPPRSLSKIELKVPNQASFFVVFLLAKKPVGCTPAIHSLNRDGHNA